MDTDARLDALLDCWQALVDSGREPSEDEVLTMCRACPDLLGQFQQDIRKRKKVEAYRGEVTRNVENLASGWYPGLQPEPGYELLRLLGKGGAGEVWQAIRKGKKPVALKVLNGGLARIEWEQLQLVYNRRHPHLIDIYDCREVGSLLIVEMALAEMSLHELIQNRQKHQERIPFEEAIHYLKDAAEGLDFLHHSCGLVHRDIKPENLLLLGGSVLLGDFGLIKWMSSDQTAHSGRQTNEYAAPELFHSNTVTYRSDQYSLGLTYHELRTGEHVFQDASDRGNIIHAHLKQVPNLDTLAGLSLAEADVVARALAKKPEDRWDSCGAFVDALLVANRKSPIHRIVSFRNSETAHVSVCSRVEKPFSINDRIGLLWRGRIPERGQVLGVALHKTGQSFLTAGPLAAELLAELRRGTQINMRWPAAHGVDVPVEHADSNEAQRPGEIGKLLISPGGHYSDALPILERQVDTWAPYQILAGVVWRFPPEDVVSPLPSFPFSLTELLIIAVKPIRNKPNGTVTAWEFVLKTTREADHVVLGSPLLSADHQVIAVVTRVEDGQCHAWTVG